jgi:3-methyladenine DNA glycosylase AlkD
MLNPLHQEILTLIRKKSGKPAKDAFLNSYLGNHHVRYAIGTPALRAIAKDWMRLHKDLPAEEFVSLLTSLIEGASFTEKVTAGILLSYSTKDQRKFNPAIFDQWLSHLVGWAEVDAVCTGDFHVTQAPSQWPEWKKLLNKLSKDPNINKRRASLVLLCSPISRIKDDRMAEMALKNIERLKGEKDVLITKAISWVLRSMIKHYRAEVAEYVNATPDLPKIAIRETLVKLKTGKKNPKLKA